MAFADPQSVTINAVAVSLPRTSSGASSGDFMSNDGTVKLGIAQEYKTRIARRVRLDHQKYAADPLISAQNVLRSMSVSLVVNVPKQGYTVVEQKQVVDALVAWLSASSGAKITQLLGGEI